MSRYFFDTSDQNLTVVDVEGMDLPGDDKAIAEACSGLVDIAREVIVSRRSGKASVSVRDEKGSTIFSMSCTIASDAAIKP